MSITIETPGADSAPSIEDVRQFLYREARSLDDKDWDDWLASTRRTRSSGCRPGTTTTSS